MEIGGWKTRAVFDSYDIKNEDDLREAAAMVSGSRIGKNWEKRAKVKALKPSAKVQRASSKTLPGEGVEPSLGVTPQGDFKSRKASGYLRRNVFVYATHWRFTLWSPDAASLCRFLGRATVRQGLASTRETTSG